jgi:hypothetical protein
MLYIYYEKCLIRSLTYVDSGGARRLDSAEMEWGER